MLVSDASTIIVYFGTDEKGGLGKSAIAGVIADLIGPSPHRKGDRPDFARSTTSPFRHDRRRKRPA